MKLILYHFDTCPFCVIVRNALERLKITEVEYRDILAEPKYKDELIALNGMRQVPCLVIDGTPMLESEEIVEFLEESFG